MAPATLEQHTTAVRAEAGKYLTFILGSESYGIAVLKIREIIRIVNITAVPQMPDYVKGVINLRGKIIPVIDLRLKFGIPKAEMTERTCIIVVQVDLHSGVKSQMGLVVDGVEEVTHIASVDIEETPDFGTKLDTDSILGMAKIKGVLKTLLDIDKVVSTDAVQRKQKIS
jgi:purine-binding chemotaxis protein CheW